MCAHVGIGACISGHYTNCTHTLDSMITTVLQATHLYVVVSAKNSNPIAYIHHPYYRVEVYFTKACQFLPSWLRLSL